MLKTFDYNKMPVVEVVNEIMVDSAKRGASDIHFDPLETFMKIRIRIDGNLIDYALVPNDIKKNLITRIKIISGMNITESRLPQDGAIKATLQGISLDLRVSTIPTNMGEKIVIRILDYSLSGAGIEKLGFSENNYKKVIEMINQPNGIILVTGATGSGKSTTVYSILQRLNKETTNIVTVEDPVEMNIEGVNQIQANSEIGLDFATALRSILRQDPNIIMIGEIRDIETAKIAVRASITGHLVLSTLHTNDSLNTIERLLDMDVERYLLASSLTGIIAQKLARKLCPHCRKEVKANPFEAKLFETLLGHKVDKLYVPVGCDKCHNGYKGRIAIQEVLLINQQIRDAISMNYSKDKLRNLVYNGEVDSLLQDGLKKVEAGYTSMEELLKLIELENEESTVAKMGVEASLRLAQEVEGSLAQQEIENEKKIKEEEKIVIEEEENDGNTEETIDDFKTEDDTTEETIDNFNVEDDAKSEDENVDDLKVEDEINDDNSIIDFDSFNDDIETPSLEENNNIDEPTETVDEVNLEPSLDTLDETTTDDINTSDDTIFNFNDLDINNDDIPTPTDDTVDIPLEDNNQVEDNNFEAPIEEKKVEPVEEEKETKRFGLFKHKKKKNKDIVEEPKEEKEETIDNFKTESDDLFSDNAPVEDLSLNNLSNDNENVTDNLFNDDEINNIFDNNNSDELLNNDYSFTTALDNIDDNDNQKKYDFSDANGSDLIINDFGPKHEDTIDLSSLNFDVDEPTIDLKNVKVSPDALFTDDLKDGSLDDDLSNASDSDIMDLFD